MDILDTFTLPTLPTSAIHFSEDRYVRTLLERTGDYDVYVICWKAGQVTPIHDHPEGGCWMRVLQGCLEETEYDAMDLSAPLRSHSLPTGSVGFKKGGHPLHVLRAVEDSISIHVYMPPKYVPRVYAA